ncbi:MAG: glycosyltransferase family 4 protein [Candidatus Glassbacteria bacterium]|nr:glycosyltransferase family 4 protein [Candidatus Glassbacteria bacterium]
MVTGAYFPEISGAGLQCRSLIAAARDDTLSFCVVTTCRDARRTFLDLVDGVRVYRLPVNGPTWRIFPAWLYRICFLFFKVLNRVDLIHLHGFSRKSWLFLLYGLVARKKVLLKMSSLGVDDPLSVRRGKGLPYLFYRLADYYLAPGPALEEAFRGSALDSGRLVVLPNGVDCERFRPAGDEEKRTLRTLLGLPQESVLVLFVGHFSSEKRPDLLARAWSSLAGDIGLVMVGATDPEAFEVESRVVDQVKQAAARAKVPGSLVLVERTSRVEDYFLACDIFALPSVREGLPNALLEAMACALACVAARLPGATDQLLGPQAGVLVEPDDCEGLARAIEKLAGDSALRKRLGDGARNKILSGGYELEQVAASYRQFYFRAAGPGSG